MKGNVRALAAVDDRLGDPVQRISLLARKGRILRMSRISGTDDNTQSLGQSAGSSLFSVCPEKFTQQAVTIGQSG